MKPQTLLGWAVAILVIDCLLTMIRWQITKYSISCDGRIIVVPPLQDLSKFGDGVSNSIYSRLIPSLVRALDCHLYQSNIK